MDSKLPEFFHALFALLAHVILISLVIAWGASLLHRMVRKDLRAYFFIVAVLVLFFLVIRMIKYGLTRDIEALSRYLWYSYYVSQCLIPPTLLLASLSIENKKGKSLKKLWYFIYLPAFILLAFIYTNDLHQWAFALYFNKGEFSYSHRFIFYMALVWEILITIISLIVMIMKCRVSACKKKIEVYPKSWTRKEEGYFSWNTHLNLNLIAWTNIKGTQRWKSRQASRTRSVS